MPKKIYGVKVNVSENQKWEGGSGESATAGSSETLEVVEINFENFECLKRRNAKGDPELSDTISSCSILTKQLWECRESFGVLVVHLNYQKKLCPNSSKNCCCLRKRKTIFCKIAKCRVKKCPIVVYTKQPAPRRKTRRQTKAHTSKHTEGERGQGESEKRETRKS